MGKSNDGHELNQDAVFAIVPDWVIRHPELSAGAVRIYAVLARYTGPDLTAFPSRGTIAKDAGVSVKTVDRYLNELRAAGAVLSTKRMKEDGDYSSNLYTLFRLPPNHTRDTDDPTLGTGLSLPGDTDDSGTRTTEREPPELRWSRRWCQLTGQVPTRSVLKRMVPQVAEYMKAAGHEPTEELMNMAIRQGINTPAGWGFVKGATTPMEVNTVLPDCERCGNRRWVFVFDEEGHEIAVRCTECWPEGDKDSEH